MQLSTHVRESEVMCPCGCGRADVTLDIIQLFEKIRAKCTEKLGHDAPIRITSGYRCQRHNDSLPQAVKGSYHTKGMALDLQPPKSMSYLDFWDICSETIENAGAVIRYSDHRCIHIDHRGIWRRLLIVVKSDGGEK